MKNFQTVAANDHRNFRKERKRFDWLVLAARAVIVACCLAILGYSIISSIFIGVRGSESGKLVTLRFA